MALLPVGRCRAGSAPRASGWSRRLGARRGRGLSLRPATPAISLGSSPFLARTRTRWPSATSSPTLWSRWATIPSSNDVIGIIALSVSTSARVSPSLTWSPTLTSHWVITPLSIVGLSLGIVTSIGTVKSLQVYCKAGADHPIACRVGTAHQEDRWAVPHSKVRGRPPLRVSDRGRRGPRPRSARRSGASRLRGSGCRGSGRPWP